MRERIEPKLFDVLHRRSRYGRTSRRCGAGLGKTRSSAAGFASLRRSTRRRIEAYQSIF
jgi:hypothetical protein